MSDDDVSEQIDQNYNVSLKSPALASNLKSSKLHQNNKIRTQKIAQ